jgi:hypothetical protein
MLNAADPLAVSARDKLDRIKADKAKRGSTITLSLQELNAYMKVELGEEAQLGIRDSKLVMGTGTFEISAIVDFRKMAESRGHEVNALFAKMLEGERPLRISASLESASSKATLRITTLEISGIPMSGFILDFIMKTVMSSLSPDAKYNEPFDLKHNMERIEIQPANARVVIKK